MREVTRTTKIETSRGAVEFHVTQLPGRPAGMLLMRLGRLFGPSIATIAGSLSPEALRGGDIEGALTSAGLPAAVRELFAEITEAEFERLTQTLLASAQVVHGGEIHDALPQLDSLFQGNALGLFRLLWFALQANYGNFIDALAPFASAQGKKASASKA